MLSDSPNRMLGFVRPTITNILKANAAASVIFALCKTTAVHEGTDLRVMVDSLQIIQTSVDRSPIHDEIFTRGEGCVKCVSLVHMLAIRSSPIGAEDPTQQAIRTD